MVIKRCLNSRSTIPFICQNRINRFDSVALATLSFNISWHQKRITLHYRTSRSLLRKKFCKVILFGGHEISQRRVAIVYDVKWIKRIFEDKGNSGTGLGDFFYYLETSLLKVNSYIKVVLSHFWQYFLNFNWVDFSEFSNFTFCNFSFSPTSSNLTIRHFL